MSRHHSNNFLIWIVFTFTEILCFGSPLYHYVKQAEANIITDKILFEALVLWSKPKISWLPQPYLSKLFYTKIKIFVKIPSLFFYSWKQFNFVRASDFHLFSRKHSKKHIFSRKTSQLRENLFCYKAFFTKLFPLFHIFLTSFAIFVVNLMKSLHLLI